jgi:hypothetical protein
VTAETPSAAAPARPARSYAAVTSFPGHCRPGEYTACVARARARTAADPALIDLVARARTFGKRARDAPAERHAALREAFAALPPTDSGYCRMAEPSGEPGEAASKPITLRQAGESQ